MSSIIKEDDTASLDSDQLIRYQGTGEMGRVKVDSGMVVVIFICMMYIVLVFGLLFYVKNDWCDLLFKNMTVWKRKMQLSFIFWFSGECCMSSSQL